MMQTTNKKVFLPFDKLQLESDSHGRHLASLLMEIVDERTAISGTCKPAARLANIVPPHPPSPGTCRVIIAGTNDVAAGQHNNMYRNLERCISKIPSTSAVLLATLPFRHDLPYAHPVNEEIMFLNAYISELCARHDNVGLLDFNHIGRKSFSAHGMHLKIKGKRQLARIIVESARLVQLPISPGSSPSTATPPAAAAGLGLERAERAASTNHPPPPAATPPAAAADGPGPERAERAASTNHPPPATSTSTHPASPIMLPHDSYADAVKLSSQYSRSPGFLENNILVIGLD